MLGVFLLLWLAVPATAAEPQTVTLTTRDGVQITGSLFLPERHPAPAVVLLHMMTRSRQDWYGTAQKLAKGGIAALSIDFRRAGQPQTDEKGSNNLADLVLDAEAARAFLAARPEIAPGRIGIAGASVGANVAAIAAGFDESVKSLALLSPSLEYRNLRIEPALRKYGSRPALLVASSEDPYALRSARSMVAMGDGPRELRVLSGAGHGTVMLGRDLDLATALVDWFLRTLL
jgi:dienelactone hydrolase